MPAATASRGPSARRRPASSPAARRVKVMTSTWLGSADPSRMRRAMRRVSTRVLPEPAGATTQSGAPSESTAVRCSGSRSSRSGSGATRHTVDERDPALRRSLRSPACRIPGAAEQPREDRGRQPPALALLPRAGAGCRGAVLPGGLRVQDGRRGQVGLRHPAAARHPRPGGLDPGPADQLALGRVRGDDGPGDLPLRVFAKRHRDPAGPRQQRELQPGDPGAVVGPAT